MTLPVNPWIIAGCATFIAAVMLPPAHRRGKHSRSTEMESTRGTPVVDSFAPLRIILRPGHDGRAPAAANVDTNAGEAEIADDCPREAPICEHNNDTNFDSLNNEAAESRAEEDIFAADVLAAESDDTIARLAEHCEPDRRPWLFDLLRRRSANFTESSVDEPPIPRDEVDVFLAHLDAQASLTSLVASTSVSVGDDHVAETDPAAAILEEESLAIVDELDRHAEIEDVSPTEPVDITLQILADGSLLPMPLKIITQATTLVLVEPDADDERLDDHSFDIQTPQTSYRDLTATRPPATVEEACTAIMVYRAAPLMLRQTPATALALLAPLPREDRNLVHLDEQKDDTGAGSFVSGFSGFVPLSPDEIEVARSAAKERPAARNGHISHGYEITWTGVYLGEEGADMSDEERSGVLDLIIGVRPLCAAEPLRVALREERDLLPKVIEALRRVGSLDEHDEAVIRESGNADAIELIERVAV